MRSETERMPPEATESSQIPAPRRRKFAVRLSNVQVMPVLIVVMIVGFALLNDRFFTQINALSIANQATFLIIVALGQGIVLLTGGFDLSVGAAVSLTSVVTGWVLTTAGVSGTPLIALAVLAGVGVGVLIGLVNGVSVAFLGVPPFIATLGASGAAGGAALLVSGGLPITGLPPGFVSTFGTPHLDTISFPIYFTAALCAVVWFVVSRTTAGRRLYAVGGNAKAARLSGISVSQTLLAAYVTAGLLAAVAGILLSARVATGDANLGGQLVLQSITAGVLGGISLSGGEGRITGAITGALFVAILSNGMNLVGVQSYYQMVVLGTFLIAAAVIEHNRGRDVFSKFRTRGS
jgi:ribose transport system permease protein